MLTDAKLRKLKGKKHAYRVYDKASDPGFGVRVTPSGHISFFLLYTADGRERFMNLGRYTGKNLGDARARARDERLVVDAGKDPQQVKAAQRAEDKRQELRAKSRGTVSQLLEKYIERLKTEGKRSAEQVQRFHKAYIKDVIGKEYAGEVQPDDIRRVLRPIINRGKLVLANRVRSYLVAAFNFGLKWKDSPNYDPKLRFEITMNPAHAVQKPLQEEKPGQRVLTEDEIRDLWAKWGNPEFMPQPAGLVLRFILASGGQRVEEALRAETTEFDVARGIWELPPERTKNGRWHVVPISDLLKEELGLAKCYREALKEPPTTQLVFPIGEGYMRTDSLSRAVRRFCEKHKVKPFTPRDLRRTAKTQMGFLGISKESRDRLQGHAMTDVSSKHYDRYDYLAEKRDAVNQWEAYLRRVVAGKGAKVVTIGKRA